MKYLLLGVSGLLIIITIFILIDLIVYLNKNQNKKVDSIKDGLNKRVNILKYLSIIIVITGIISIVCSVFNLF